ncbi:hypothetical protein, partial [Sinorhizobium meliloti]|uniref:hypothetical protein n=1 Tax=Rhizobium meliloti TaxID=382 RepID=UPI001AED10EF
AETMLRPAPLPITCALTNMIATDVSRLVQARRVSDVYCALKPIGLPGPMPLLGCRLAYLTILF